MDPMANKNERHSKGEVKDFFDGLYLWDVKVSGPNPGGKGHASKTLDTMGGVKTSGPSPGQGHGRVTTIHK
ncbi:hypothetical protein QJS10_CPA02g00377 [Acorus calamus]|uniref:Uncharacterized protein n=1 Tax=Acorus calamus TaxID=4465 RepID=A0AAV9FDA3_ACOCL|nr:hypothetical protein QJS10_CPA02g00377 [Acorus calamus]